MILRWIIWICNLVIWFKFFDNVYFVTVVLIIYWIIYLFYFNSLYDDNSWFLYCCQFSHSTGMCIFSWVRNFILSYWLLILLYYFPTGWSNISGEFLFQKSLRFVKLFLYDSTEHPVCCDSLNIFFLQCYHEL